MAMTCAYHPDREAAGACVNCGQLVCDECKTALGGKIYCNPCANKLFVSETSGAGNTSGQGSLAIVPADIGGWSWGGFCLGWRWSIGNSVW